MCIVFDLSFVWCVLGVRGLHVCVCVVVCFCLGWFCVFVACAFGGCFFVCCLVVAFEVALFMCCVLLLLSRVLFLCVVVGGVVCLCVVVFFCLG